MRSSFPGPRRAAAALSAVVVLAGLAGCGGSDGGGEPAPPGSGGTATTATAPSAAPSFTALAAAVCRAEVGGVPPVPDPQKAGPAEQRRYVRGVETAAGGLAAAFVALERRRPESQATLEPLVTRARAVERAARVAARGATGESGDVRLAIARLNEASSAARLPACAL